MRFTCEQCGKRYTTSDVLQPGRTYRTKCKACGNIIVVKGTDATPPSGPAPTPAPASIPPARPSAAPLNPPSAPAIVTQAVAAPPSPPPAAAAEPKYIDLFEGESLDDLAASPSPPAAQARRKGAVSPAAPEPAARASSSGSPPPLGQLFSSPAPETTPVNTALKQTRPPAYFGDIQPAAQEAPPPPEPPKARETPTPRDVPPPSRRGLPFALIAVVAGLVVAALVGVVWRPWEKSGGAQVAQVLPPPTNPVAPPPEPTQPAQEVTPPEPTPPPVVEPVQPQQSPEELARLEKERERQEKLAKAEQERQARLERLEKEKADKAAKAEEARLARLEKLEREKAEKAAKAEEARLARLEKLEKEKADKAAKAEEARLAKLEKLEKEKADKAARAEQERLARLERDKAEREKSERDRAEREKAARAEQERLAKLPVGLGPEVIQTALASARKSFDDCVKNPSRGLDRPLEARQLRLRFMVQPQGVVSNPTIDDAVASGAPVGQCLKAAATALKFPEFRGDAVQVDTPIALPVPPPAATAAATGPVNVVVFTGPKSTRAGSAVGDTVYSERTEDAAITDHQFENGVVTYSGQVGFGKGSTWAGIGINVDILPDGKPIDATRFKSVTFRLASPTSRSLRLRLIGNEPAVNQKGCYPTTLIRVTKDLKDYTFNFKDFDPETWCGSSGRTAAKTIPGLIGFEIADIHIQGKPTSFSVGTITLNP